MKYTLLVLLFLLEPVHAIQFNRCVDSEGNAYYTNLPLETLDTNCKQKQNYYSLRLNADYQRLRKEMDNPRALQAAQNQESVIETVKTAINEAVDPVKALEQLLENTSSSRENTATEFFKARTVAIEEILKAD